MTHESRSSQLRWLDLTSVADSRSPKSRKQLGVTESAITRSKVKFAKFADLDCDGGVYFIRR